MSRLLLHAVIGVAWIVVGCAWAAADEPADQGSHGIWQILRQQGFSSELDDGGAEISRICSMRTPGGRYEFYHYVHVNPHPVWQSVHMIEALVEVRDGATYLGKYSLTATTPSCDTRTNEVLFT